MQLNKFAAIAASAGLLAAALPAGADEGMWTFDGFPAAKMRGTYGWAPDQAWLDKVRGAAVRLTGGCSASFVSGEGLILTNHHCVAQCAQDNSSNKKDYLADGFIAGDRARELKCPGQQAELVTAITDVTPRLTAAIGKATGQALTKARDAAIAGIESENCTDKATTRCQVVTLFGGGQYKLYKYRKYSDVRLVWAPEFAAAFFGGDPDNFNFPRYNLDASFLRAYENGRPAATPQHLTWNPRGPIANEATFVVGNPGRTQRLLTQDQLRFQREQVLPLTITLMSELRGRLIAESAESAEKKREAGDTLFGIENSYKVYWGQARALDDEAFAKQLAANEATLKAKAGKRYGDPWGAIAKADADYRDLFLDYYFLEQRAGFGSQLYSYARTLVRAAAEREKPNAERLPGYTDSALPLVEKNLVDPVPITPWLEQTHLEFWLSKAREYLTADSPQVKALLGRESPESLSARLVKGTGLADPATRQRLFAGGMAAIRASNDPLIQFVLRNDPAARALRTAYAEKVDAPVTAAQAQLAKARFGAYGAGIYPDATFTLRISYGKVAGWTERGRAIPFETTVAGLYDRATGQDPFVLAPAYAKAKSKLDLATPFDFVTTNDIIGGNSGSPVIAKDGSVIGAAFDGNIHSLGGNFGYDPVLNRTVVVSTAAIQQALEQVYPAPSIVAELGSKLN